MGRRGGVGLGVGEEGGGGRRRVAGGTEIDGEGRSCHWDLGVGDAFESLLSDLGFVVGAAWGGNRVDAELRIRPTCAPYSQSRIVFLYF